MARDPFDFDDQDDRDRNDRQGPRRRRRGQEDLPAPPRQRPLEKGGIICPNRNCGYRGEPLMEPRGNFLVAVLLLCMFVLPGILYCVFMAGYNYTCPRCGIHIRPGRHV